jgi:ATP adenylyltransferase
LASACTEQLQGKAPFWPWQYRLSPREHCGAEQAAAELRELYERHQWELGLGSPQQQPQPLHPYNLVIEPNWFMTVVRSQEHWAGLSINALGFAGCLLITPESDTAWLQRHGPLALLAAVAREAS